MRDMPMAREPDAGMLLALWERALAAPAAARDDALVQAAFDAEAPPRTIGERNLRLMALHARWFGAELALLSHCPSCAGAVEFSGDCDAIALQKPPGGQCDAAAVHRLEVLGHVVDFRLPGPDDLAAATDAPGEDVFVQCLLDRCVLACRRDGAPLPVQQLPAAVLEALSERMEALDPAASVSFALQCPHCGTPWLAPLDVGALVWQQLRAAAERVLLEVDTLARAYGWSEPEVLCLNPARRAAYLQMALA